MRPPVPAPRISQESPTSTTKDDEETKPPELPARLRREKPAKNPHTEASSSEDQIDNLIEFARRKNFTESEIDKAIKRSTFPADTNYFLSQLISVRAEESNDNFSAIRTRPESLTTRYWDADKLKNIVLDGSNIAMTHGNGKFFSCRGIKLAVDWFRQRGHKSIKAFVPAHRKEATPGNRDVDILLALSAQGIVIFTPSRELPNKTRVTCYDDRFILRYASEQKAVVVSNDQYRDLVNEDVTYREIVGQRLLPYMFVDNSFMPAEDPMGKRGMTLGQFLRLDATDPSIGQCPYGRKCTYGIKCKFGHAERESSSISEELQKKQEQLQKFIQRKGTQENNNCMSNLHQSQPVTHSSLPSQLGYHSSHIPEFRSHPANIMAMPMLVSRGLGDGAEQFPSHRPSEKRLGPQKVTLQQDNGFPNSGKTLRPVPDPTQHRRPHNTKYAPPMSAYPNSFPPYPNQPIHPPPPPNPHLNDHTNGIMNGTLHQSRFVTNQYQDTSVHTDREENAFRNESDPRYKIYFHLKSLFSEHVVQEAMGRLPNETDPKKICQLIMQM